MRPLRNRIYISDMKQDEFFVMGYHQLPEDLKQYVWKELKAGHELQLIAHNHSNNKAIKVLFKDKHIGWFPENHSRKDELFNILLKGRGVKARCKSNDRGPEYIREGFFDRYVGIRQYVYVEFECE